MSTEDELRDALELRKQGPMPERVPSDFVEKLLWTQRFGEISVRRMRDGWYAGIDMHVSGEGAAFSVRSDFNHARQGEALDVCIQRMLDTLSKYGVNK
jgi:hypothetical protein